MSFTNDYYDLINCCSAFKLNIFLPVGSLKHHRPITMCGPATTNGWSFAYTLQYRQTQNPRCHVVSKLQIDNWNFHNLHRGSEEMVQSYEAHCLCLQKSYHSYSHTQKTHHQQTAFLAKAPTSDKTPPECAVRDHRSTTNISSTFLIFVFV